MRLTSRSAGLLLAAMLVSAGASPARAAQPSETCNGSPLIELWNLVGPRVNSQKVDTGPSSAAICFYASMADAAPAGVRLDITGVSLQATVDDKMTDCGTLTTVLSGQIGDPANPPAYLPYRVAATVSRHLVEICVEAGPLGLHIEYPPAGPAMPGLNVVEDSRGKVDAFAGSWQTAPGGSASSLCDIQLLSYYLYGGITGFVSTTGSQTCVRSVTWTHAYGGRIDLTGIALPTEVGHTFAATCAITLYAGPAPVALTVRVSAMPPTGNDWVCITALGTVDEALRAAPGYTPPSTDPGTYFVADT